MPPELAAGSPEPTLRDRILYEAGRLFQAQGYEGTSLKVIARQVGVTSAAIYWHFESKEHILVEFVQTSLQSGLDSIRGALNSTSDPETRLRAYVSAHVAHVLDRRQLGRPTELVHKLRNTLSEETVERIRTLESTYLHIVSGIVSDGIREGKFRPVRPGVAAFSILAMCDDVIFWFDPSGALSVPELGDELGDLAVAMVSPQ